MTAGPVDVLLLAFVRPDLLERAVEPLRGAAIRQVYLALDGPRFDRPEDHDLIESCERVVREAFAGQVPVEVLRRSENLGMKQACVSAIDWFFTHTDAGIIVEEDCVVDPTFLGFAAELLERFRDDGTVMGICGTCAIGVPPPPLDASYGFSRNFGAWGWATWARAWRSNNPGLDGVDDAEIQRVLRSRPGSSFPFRRYWSRLLVACREGRDSNWDFPWAFSVWRAGGVFIRPDRNLVSNIGHDERATQTTSVDPRLSALPTSPMPLPLQHPVVRIHDIRHDRWVDRRIKGIRWSLLAKWGALRLAAWLGDLGRSLR